MNRKTIKIDLEKIKEIAFLGVRRTGIFMGLGINAALDKNFRNFDLTKITQFQFIPTDVDDKTISHIKEEFGNWIISCGFRELIETFAVFLDKIHNASLHIAVSSRKLSPKYATKFHRNFIKRGIKDKLPLFFSRFNIQPYNDPGYIISINQVRNCFAHRRGIVGIEDCGDKQTIEVKWLGFDIFLETPSGEIFYTHMLPEEGITLEDGGYAGVNFSERTRTFKIGEQIKFTPKDLAEICYFIILSTNDISKSFINYAKSLDIIIDPLN